MGLPELTRNAVDVLPKGELERKLALGRPLRVKLGIDVTSPDIHVGRAIPLQRMRAFQDEGHVGVLIIGDYTTRIGDPSGRSAERPVLSDEEIDRNAKTYVEQAMIVLDPDRTEVRFRRLPDAALEQYVRLESPLDCAGSFKAEGLGVVLFEQISSQDPTALIGLPLIFVAHALRTMGADPLL